MEDVPDQDPAKNPENKFQLDFVYPSNPGYGPPLSPSSLRNWVPQPQTLSIVVVQQRICTIVNSNTSQIFTMPRDWTQVREPEQSCYILYHEKLPVVKQMFHFHFTMVHTDLCRVMAHQ